MSHDLATIDGKINFASHRKEAWHRLGTVADELTRDNMLELAHLADWDLQLLPSLALTPDGGLIADPMKRAHTRMRDNTVLGTVGTAWHSFSNEKLRDLAFNAIEKGGIDTGMVQPETALAIKGGRVVILVFSLPRDCWTLADDEHVPYFTLANGHDGTLSITPMATMTRTVCKNTWELAQSQTVTSMKIRHRSGVELRAEEIAKTIGFAISAVGEYQAEAEVMMNTAFTAGEFDAFLDSLLPKAPADASKRSVTIAENKRTAVRRIYEVSPTIGKFKDTRWGAFQAANEYEVWFQGGAGADTAARAERTILKTLKGFPITQAAEALLVPERVLVDA